MPKQTCHIIRIGDTVVSCQKVNAVEFYHNQDDQLIFRFVADGIVYENIILISALTHTEERIVIEVIKNYLEYTMMRDVFKKKQKVYETFDFGSFVEHYISIRKEYGYDVGKIMNYYDVSYIQDNALASFTEIEYAGPTSNN